MKNKSISVIIPCRNEKMFIQKILNNIVLQDYDKNFVTIYVIDGMSNDGTKEIILDFAKDYSNIKFIENPEKTVPFALNKGINNSKSDIVVRMDAHAEYPLNYLSTLVFYLDKLDADNVGASVITVPYDNTLKAISISVAMSTPFGVGNATFRLKGNENVESIEVDTVPFGCYKRSVFDKVGLFDEELTRNQDNEFNERLKNSGGKIFLIPSLKIVYFARENYKQLFKMFFQYGYFGPLVDIKLGRPTRIRRYIPLIFVLSLILPLFFALVHSIFFNLWLFIVLSYFVCSLLFSLYESYRITTFKLFPYLMWAFFVSHISYGFGYLRGVLDFMILRERKKNLDVKLSR